MPFHLFAAISDKFHLAARGRIDNEDCGQIVKKVVDFGQIKQLLNLTFHFDTIDANDICTISGRIACERKKVYEVDGTSVPR